LVWVPGRQSIFSARIQGLVQAQRAQDLRFLAAHIVGDRERVAAGKSRHDVDAALFQGNAGFGDLRRQNRCRQVWRLNPADVRTHHTAQHDGQHAMAFAPRRNQCLQCCCVAAAAGGGARTRGALQARARGIAQEQAQMARAPITDNHIPGRHLRFMFGFAQHCSPRQQHTLIRLIRCRPIRIL